MNEVRIFEKLNSSLTYNEIREMIEELLTSLNQAGDSRKKSLICKRIISEKIEFFNIRELIELYYVSGKNLYYANEIEESEKYTVLGLELLNDYCENKPETMSSRAAFLYTALYNLRGSISLEYGNIFDSINFFGLAYEKSFFCDDIRLNNILLANIGIVFTNLNMYEKALEIFEISKNFVFDNLYKDNYYLRTTLSNIALNQGLCYAELGDIKKAKELYNEVPIYLDPNSTVNFKYYYYNLQSLIYQKEGIYEKADELFDEVFSYFINNEKVDNSTGVLILYLKEYLKREHVSEARLKKLEVLSKQKIKKSTNAYNQAILEFFGLKYICKSGKIKNFKESFSNYKNAVNNAYQIHYKEHKSAFNYQYEQMLSNRKKLNSSIVNIDYNNIKENITVQEKIYKEAYDSLNFISQFSSIMDDESDYEERIIHAKKTLKKKINFDIFAIAIVDEIRLSIDFIVVDENEEIRLLKAKKDQINKNVLETFEKSSNKPFATKINDDSYICKKLGKNYDRLFISKLVVDEEVNAVAILYSNNAKENIFDDLVNFEIISPYISIMVQKHYLRNEIQKERELFEIYTSKLEEMNQIIKSMPKMDGLTGVPNKSNFDSESLKLYRKAMDFEKKLSMLIIDIDNFSAYNQHYGYKLADKAIRKIANSLYHKSSSLLDTKDAVFVRYFSDLFVLLYIDYGTISIEELSKDLIHVVEDLNIENVKSPTNKISVGIGAGFFFPKKEKWAIQAFFKHCENLLHMSKMKGENSHTILEFKQ